MNIVLDTSVFISALLSASGAAREVLRRCLLGRHVPCMSLALFAAYRDVLGREGLFADCPLDARERQELFDAVMSVGRMTEIYFLWRPNLKDEGDNHLLELAVAAQAGLIVTHHLADFRVPQLKFAHIRILTPGDFLKEDR